MLSFYSYPEPISIHVPREGDDRTKQLYARTDKSISIHVPREGDDQCLCFGYRLRPISIHVPREGDD